MFVALSGVIKRTGGAIAGCIVAPMLVTLVFSLVDTFLNLNDFALSDYWLDGLFSSAASSNEHIAATIAFSLFYSALFFVAGIIINRKQEL